MNGVDRSVFDTLLPADPAAGLPSLLDAGFERWLEDYRREASFELRLGLRLALFCAGWIAPLLVFRCPPLSLHGRATRERALAALGGSRSYLLRQMILVLKATAGFCYGAHAGVRDALAFPLQHDDPRKTGVRDQR